MLYRIYMLTYANKFNPEAPALKERKKTPVNMLQ